MVDKLIAKCFFVVIILTAVCIIPAAAMDVVRPLKSTDFLVRNGYAFEILTEALRHTSAKYGPFIEIPFEDTISVARSHSEAIKGELINIMISDGNDSDYTRAMIPIPIPIDKGLLGYRVAFIRNQDRSRLDKLENIDQLRKLIVGQGRGWNDVPIYRYNGIPVEVADSYDGLFKMLAHGRFDIFPRGVIEAPAELQSYGKLYPTLRVDDRLLIVYKYANFFYLSKHSPRLALRIRDGLNAMRRDGSFNKIFNRYFETSIRSLFLANRVIITLENPYLPDWFPVKQSELWINPSDYTR